MAMFPVMVGFYWNYSVEYVSHILFLADVPVNKVDSSSSTTRGARANRQGTKIVCVYVYVSYVYILLHVRIRLFFAACSSKKSGSGKSSTVSSDGEY